MKTRARETRFNQQATERRLILSTSRNSAQARDRVQEMKQSDGQRACGNAAQLFASTESTGLLKKKRIIGD
jgi:hypothetical protein